MLNGCDSGSWPIGSHGALFVVRKIWGAPRLIRWIHLLAPLYTFENWKKNFAHFLFFFNGRAADFGKKCEKCVSCKFLQANMGV